MAVKMQMPGGEYEIVHSMLLPNDSVCCPLAPVERYPVYVDGNPNLIVWECCLGCGMQYTRHARTNELLGYEGEPYAWR